MKIGRTAAIMLSALLMISCVKIEVHMPDEKNKTAKPSDVSLNVEAVTDESFDDDVIKAGESEKMESLQTAPLNNETESSDAHSNASQISASESVMTQYEPKKDTESVQEDILPSMSAAERREVNIFLSNFSEASFNPDSDYYGEDEALINFAFKHAYINSPQMTVDDGEYMGISAANSDIILKRFFGRTVTHRTPENNRHWKYADGRFLMLAAAGESFPDFSVATEMTKRDDGNFNVRFNIYCDPSIGGGDMIADKSVYSLTDDGAAAKYDYECSGEAVLKPKIHNGKSTYELVSYSVDYNW